MKYRGHGHHHFISRLRMHLSSGQSMGLRTILHNVISIPPVLSLRGSVRPISPMGF